MGTPEDQELMAKISALAGRINRHKAQQNAPAETAHSSPRHTYHRAAPYNPRGRYNQYRQPSYRHKTLVLNGQSQPAAAPATEPSDSTGPANSSWVSKTDRHMQLINTSVYEKEAQSRSHAIEKTQRQKQVDRDAREKARFASHATKQAAGSSDPSKTSKYEMEVEGISFRVLRDGNKLIKAPGDPNPPAATPKTAYIGGVRFHRTKNGNLVRHGIIKAKRLASGIKKVDEQCKTFSWNGSCSKGSDCRYQHDVSKVAMCKDWLLKSDCPRGDNCDLSHEITEERAPLCMHFAKGKCSNPSCPYVHAEHSQADPVCRAFGFYGYCEKGAACSDRHVFECPDFSNTGFCKVKGCKRRHIERASVLRKQNQSPTEDMGDITSDEDDIAADSDDVDSDEVEEFIGQDDGDDPGFLDQKDFISF